jgi:hypothetical protein
MRLGAGSMALIISLCRPSGALVFFYLYPDLPVWANSFRASGAAQWPNADTSKHLISSQIAVAES